MAEGVVQVVTERAGPREQPVGGGRETMDNQFSYRSVPLPGRYVLAQLASGTRRNDVRLPR